MTRKPKKPEMHGMSDTTEYHIWAHMISRCHCEKDKSYYLYGARNIKVCEKWLNSFLCFLTDMGPRPGSKYSIDRINNDGDYEPNNCRWATIGTQVRNKRNNIMLTLNGITLCEKDWANRLGMRQGTLRKRRQRGWPVEQILDPSCKRDDKKSVFLTHNGDTKCLSEWARIYGLVDGTLRDRIKWGWDVSTAITQPATPGGKKTMILYKGENLSVKEWAKKLGILYNTLASRLYRRWSLEKALVPIDKSNCPK